MNARKVTIYETSLVMSAKREVHQPLMKAVFGDVCLQRYTMYEKIASMVEGPRTQFFISSIQGRPRLVCQTRPLKVIFAVLYRGATSLGSCACDDAAPTSTGPLWHRLSRGCDCPARP
jgi:hypothetical protein